MIQFYIMVKKLWPWQEKKGLLQTVCMLGARFQTVFFGLHVIILTSEEDFLYINGLIIVITIIIQLKLDSSTRHRQNMYSYKLFKTVFSFGLRLTTWSKSFKPLCATLICSFWKHHIVVLVHILFSLCKDTHLTRVFFIYLLIYFWSWVESYTNTSSQIQLQFGQPLFDKSAQIQ